MHTCSKIELNCAYLKCNEYLLCSDNSICVFFFLSAQIFEPFQSLKFLDSSPHQAKCCLLLSLDELLLVLNICEDKQVLEQCLQ